MNLLILHESVHQGQQSRHKPHLQLQAASSTSWPRLRGGACSEPLWRAGQIASISSRNTTAGACSAAWRNWCSCATSWATRLGEDLTKLGLRLADDPAQHGPQAQTLVEHANNLRPVHNKHLGKGLSSAAWRVNVATLRRHLTGNCAGNHGLASARRPEQQHALSRSEW